MGLQQEFVKTFEEIVTPIEDAAQVSHVVQNQQISIEKKILTFPGKAISNQMILGKYRTVHARCMDLSKIMNDMHKEPGTPNYVGQYLGIDDTKGPKKHVFFKASLEKVEQTTLGSFNVTMDEYEKAYNTDMTTPPVTGIANWASYYQHLLDKTPGNI